MLLVPLASLLSDIDWREHVGKIDFTPGQVCAIAGISRVKLDYWVERAGIATRGNKQRVFDASGVELLLLIKQGRDLGLGLGASIDAARSAQARH